MNQVCCDCGETLFNIFVNEQGRLVSKCSNPFCLDVMDLELLGKNAKIVFQEDCREN